MSFAGGRPRWWIRNLVRYQRWIMFISWAGRILGKSGWNRAQNQGPSQKEDLEQPDSDLVKRESLCHEYLILGAYVFVLWLVIFHGIVNLVLLTGSPDRVRISSSQDWCSFLILWSWYANPLKAASFLMLLYVTRSSVSPFGYNAWGFLSFTMSSFWCVNGVPPNADEEERQVLGTVVPSLI